MMKVLQFIVEIVLLKIYIFPICNAVLLICVNLYKLVSV